MTENRPKYLHIFLLFAVLAVLTWSGIAPKDRVTWILETAPVFIGLILIFWSYRKFPLTDLLYVLIALHSAVLCVGGKYTYAEVPLGFWVRDLMGFTRNHYDRLGHLFQGFVPAILAREIFVRRKIVNGKLWIFILSVSVCLAFSAFYEMIEWWSALIGGEGADAFLGSQGDVWDTQWDMFLALVGALMSSFFLSKWHDSAMKALVSK